MFKPYDKVRVTKGTFMGLVRYVLRVVDNGVYLACAPEDPWFPFDHIELVPDDTKLSWW